MKRTDGAGHINNLFVSQDASIGRPPTEVKADWLNAVQEELVSLAMLDGAALDPASNNQAAEVVAARLRRLKAGAAFPVKNSGPLWHDDWSQLLFWDDAAASYKLLVPLKNRAAFLAAGVFTWNRPLAVKFVHLTLVGGGGSGATAGNSLNASGGAAGGYWRGLVDVSGVSSVSVTIGPGGARASGTGTAAIAGNNGGTSSFGSFVSCSGGTGGQINGNVPTGAGVSTSITEGLAIRGGSAGGSVAIPGLSAVYGGTGGGTPLGVGGPQSATGIDASGFGAGGGGGNSGFGAGTGGMALIEW